ncbi:MAG: NuA4 histone H4 acetyltransferase complex and the SWR1 complex subunit [Alyxoria varia]|nr:MAG: NuA4 histone H4 acetyltransferase complex and the SWR1 complex subunit [Alyxoria varia]
MPAASSVKRVKGTRIERPFVIGSESWPLDETTRSKDIPEDHTKGWRVYVRVPDGQPTITAWLKKVTFRIFHTYANPVRVVEGPPYEIRETGWGGFQVEVRLFFVPEANAKPESRSHFLQLEPFGDAESQEKQKKEKMVRSEFMDIIEFNEPPEALFEALSSDKQWADGHAKGSKGKGKGKASTVGTIAGAGGQAGGTVELPEQTKSEKEPYSKAMEKQIVGQLGKAQIELLRKIEEVEHQRGADAARARFLEGKLTELRSGQEQQKQDEQV